MLTSDQAHNCPLLVATGSSSPHSLKLPTPGELQPHLMLVHGLLPQPWQSDARLQQSQTVHQLASTRLSPNLDIPNCFPQLEAFIPPGPLAPHSAPHHSLLSLQFCWLSPRFECPLHLHPHAHLTLQAAMHAHAHTHGCAGGKAHPWATMSDCTSPS